MSEDEEFKRTHFFRLENGVEVRIEIPEAIWQERIVPFLMDRTHSSITDAIYREIIMEAMGLEVIGYQADKDDK